MRVFLLGISLLMMSCGDSFLRAEEVPAAPTVRIALVGDSTVTDQAGWGKGFAECFGAEVQCVNHAAGGRSSKSFRDEGRWEKVLAQPADYVLLQFGHNDQPGKGPARETDPQTTYKANMQRYVQEAQAKGMQPILVTSLTRRTFNDQGKIQSSLIPYVQAIAELANELDVPLIDLHTLSIAAAEEAGPKQCEAYSPAPNKGIIDRTHLNEAGSQWIGQIVAQEFVKLAPEARKSLK